MNIYIKVEIPSRELDGRLLLAMAAAERGHAVLLGDLRTLLSHRHWLPPGVFHDKSLIPSPHRMAYRAALVEAGFTLTSQDEEHGLIGAFDDWAQGRFSEGSLGQVGAAFAWGPRDATGLERAFPGRAAVIHATGSPRVDLWRGDMGGLHAGQPRPGVEASEEYVLIPTNLGVGSTNPWWAQLANMRAMSQWSEDEAAEWRHYDETAAVAAFSGRLVRAVRLAAQRFPQLRFVVRPHQTEGVEGWRMLLGEAPNISVVRSGSVSGWIRRARLVVFNGSTTGLEAAVSGVPAVAYVAGGHGQDLEVNRLARRAETPEQLIDAILATEDAGARAEWYGKHVSDRLRTTFAALDGPLAADRIVDVWESLPSSGLPTDRPRPRWSLVLASGHRTAGRLRTAARRREGDRPASIETAQKFPRLRRGEVEDIASRLRAGVGRFEAVEVRRVGPRLVSVLPSRRGA